jgi:hypothetical protein
MPCINKFEPPLQALIQPISWAMRLPPASQATRTLTTSVPLTDNCQSEQLHFLVAVWRSAFHSDSCRFVCREGGVRVRRNDETRRVGDGVDAAPGAATARRGHGSAKSPSGDSSQSRVRGRAKAQTHIREYLRIAPMQAICRFLHKSLGAPHFNNIETGMLK